MRLIEMPQCTGEQCLDVMRVWSLRNPDSKWYLIQIDRLEHKDGQHVREIIKVVVTDEEGREFLNLYTGPFIVVANNGVVSLNIGPTYGMDGRLTVQTGKRPVMVLCPVGVDTDGERLLRMEHRQLHDLPLETAPVVTEQDVAWSHRVMTTEATP